MAETVSFFEVDQPFCTKTFGVTCNGHLASTGARKCFNTRATCQDAVNYDQSSYLSLPGVAGAYASTPDSAAVSVAGDLDIRVKLAAVDWTPVAAGRVISKWRALESWLLFLNINGSLSFYISTDGTNQFSANSSILTGVVDGSAKWLRVKRVLSTGVVTFETSDDGLTWASAGGGAAIAAGVPVFDSADPIELGSDVDAQYFSGKVFYAEVRDGINGLIVAQFDPKRAERTGSTSFVARTGETWTVNGTASLVCGYIRIRLAREGQEGLDKYGNNILPLIQGDPKTTPGAVNLGGLDRNLSALGKRETVQVDLRNAKHSDLAFDPYRLERSTGVAARKYLSLPGTVGNYAQTPDSAAIDIVGDIDIRVRAAADDWTPAGFQHFMSKRPGGAQDSWLFRLVSGSTGRLDFEWTADGSTFLGGQSTASPAVLDGSPIWVRVTLDVDNGAGGRDVKFYTSPDYNPSNNTGTWAQLGATLTQAGVTSIFSGSGPLTIGGTAFGGGEMLAGKVYYAEVRNGINGTVVARFDPQQCADNATWFVSSTGELWQLSKREREWDLTQGSNLGMPLTMSRSGVATRIDSAGRVVDAPVNTLRFDFDMQTKTCRGLLTETASTNYFLWSDDATNAAWGVGDPTNPIIPNSTDIADPNGTFTATKWVLNQQAGVNRSFGGTATRVAVPGQTDTFSFYVYVPSSNSANAFSMYMFAAGDVPGDPVNLNALPRDRWQLVQYTHTWGGGAFGTVQPQFHANSPDAVGDKMYVWKPQVEPGIYASSRIPTTSAAVARGGDTPSFSDIATFYNDVEGTLVVEARLGLWDSPLQWLTNISQAGPGRISMVRTTSGGMEQSVFSNAGTGQAFIGGTAANNSIYRAAFAFKTDDISVSDNGSAVTTDNLATLPTGMSGISFGQTGGSGQLNGHLRYLTYYPKDTSDANLTLLSGTRGSPLKILPYPTTGLARITAEELYDPYTRGSLWGKWAARNTYFSNYPCRLREGKLAQTLEQMSTREYVLDKFEGPGIENSITAKDLFSKLENRKAVAPQPSTGELAADIAASGVASFTLSPASVGATYDAAGYVCVGNEIIQYTRVGDVMTVVARNALGTLADAHNAQDLVQQVLSFVGMTAVDIAYTYLSKYTSIDPVQLPKAKWDIACANLLSEVYTVRVAKPTPVAQLLGELAEQAALTWYADTQLGEITLVPLRASAVSITVNDDAWIVGGSKAIQTQRQDSRRASRVMVHYGMKDPTASLDDASNFHSRVLRVDAPSEDPTQYGAQALRQVFSRYIPQFGRTAAQAVGDRILTMFRDPPVEARFPVHYSRRDQLKLGKLFFLQTEDIQDEVGLPVLATHALTMMKGGESVLNATSQQVTLAVPPAPGVETIIPIENTAFNLNLREIYDTLYTTPVGNEVITFQVLPGVTIGSLSVLDPAIRTGSWPAGVTLKLVNQGRIQGRAGYGGASGYTVPIDARNGQGGGPALFAEYTLFVDNALGEIFGGAGGGGCGAILLQGGVGGSPGGGGAGAGTLNNAGGFCNNESIVNPGSLLGTSGAASTADNGGAGGTGGNDTYGATCGDGGNGGNPGLAGANGTNGSGAGVIFIAAGTGGAAGFYIVGNSLVTWLFNGDRRGGVS